MSPHGALAAVGLALFASGVALSVLQHRWQESGREAYGEASRSERPSLSARRSTGDLLGRMSMALLIAGAVLLVAVAGATFLWWFAVGTNRF